MSFPPLARSLVLQRLFVASWGFFFVCFQVTKLGSASAGANQLVVALFVFRFDCEIFQNSKLGQREAHHTEQQHNFLK